ncbi:LacI family DNA-binding transcriptional regulator [Pedobacter frigoris]|uniref:LacI family DNA-binding transcriptional regulator n=1 Tax=Pedobacter frigoris TaxID=2571272 RepID=UPI00292D4ECE|nr:LacI family DNA-binding transcriptional regulator [Pedobacter frigoris]
MYKPVTIKDIAVALNLSVSTVSRALRDTYDISQKTKDIVSEYAKQVNYKSNPIAVSLKNGRSYSIGIVVPELANSFFSQAIAGIESIAYERGYNTIITQTHDSEERELANVNHLTQRSVDGLLISVSSETKDYSLLKRLNEQGLPMVLFDRIIDEIPTFKVTSDNYMGAFNATELLIRSGRRRIAVLANAPQLSITNERMSGYLKALTDHRIAFNPELVKNFGKGNNSDRNISAAIQELMAMKDKPDAIFISSDRISISCIRALRKLNISTDEIMVVGFSNSDVVDLLSPSICYVRQKAFEMGRTAMEMLLKLIESKYPVTEFETRILDTELHHID